MIKESEKQFQQKIIDLARYRGFECIYHTWNSRHSPAGFPDLIMLKGFIMIVAEIKSEKGQLTPEQYFWLLAFGVITSNVYLWKPGDWKEVEEVIK